MMLVVVNMPVQAEPDTWKDNLTSYEVFVLSSMPNLHNATDADQESYVKDFREELTKLTGYEAAYMDKMNELAKTHYTLEDAIKANLSQDKIEEYESQKALKFFELEDLGITTQDRFDANPEYWINKAINAKQDIENQDTVSVSGNNDSDGIYYVHQSDLALKRTAILTWPCWEGVPCPIVNYGWNAGTSTSEIWFIPTNGQVSFRHAVCLDDDTHHDSVTFDVRIKQDIYSIIQTVLHEVDSTFERTLYSEGQCYQSIKNKDVYAGSRAGMSTGISNISLN
jgi:hypothetical protein